MDEIKFIVEKVNEVLSTDYNCFSFNNISGDDLKILLVRVMESIGIADKSILQQNDNICLVVLNILNGIKYVPVTKVSPKDFRESLSSGAKQIIHPILFFLLKNIENVKKRHYLSKYVTKVDVPSEFLSDQKVSQLNDNYLKLIDDFWTNYSINKKEKEKAQEAAELEQDIFHMKNDLTNLERRFNIQKDKLRTEVDLALVTKYCKETQRNEKLINQRDLEQKNLSKMQDECRWLEQRGSTKTIEELIENAEYNQQTLKMFEGFIKDLEDNLDDFKVVCDNLEPSRKEIYSLQENVAHLDRQIRELKAEKSGLIDDNVDMCINQLKLFAKKKEMLSKQIMKLRLRNEEVSISCEYICSLFGGDVLTGKNLKTYVNNLRELSTVYKNYRKKLNALETERSVLNHTLEVLYDKDPSLKNKIEEQTYLFSKFDSFIGTDKIVEEIKKLHRQYEKVEINVKVTAVTHLQIKDGYELLLEEYADAKASFNENTGNLSDEVERLTKEFDDLQNSIEKAMDELNICVNEAENYKENLLRFSQLCIESTDDVPYLQTVLQKLKYEQDRRDELTKRLELKEGLLENERKDIQEIVNIRNMVLCKINNSLF